MSKSPVLAYVKTRMQPHLSQQQSLNLHIKLAQYCLRQWMAIDDFSINLWVGGDIEKYQSDILLPMKNDFLTRHSIYAQPEGDLGKRMLFAINSTFTSGQGNAFLVGTDCPFIDKHYFLQAAAALEKNDVVIGPATDGGYVLLGMKQSYEALFENISWGTSSVLAQTQCIIQREGLQSLLLPPLSDIDEVGDLTHLLGYDEFSDFHIQP